MPLSGVDVEVRSGAIRLPGTLAAPPEASQVVVFAHGSGSSRLSPRNVSVAKRLQADGLATLLFDLLTPDEAADRRNVFDIALLGRRLTDAVEWVGARDGTRDLAVGLFGASTGAAAALVAAAERDVAAVVSRGGRPDLAGGALAAVRAPTLLIVGGLDREVLELNRAAQQRMSNTEVRLEVVAGATHLFEEAGTLEQVAGLASDWFLRHG